VSHSDDCSRFIECLSAHFDGELDPELEKEFRLHYETCERARVLVRTFERTIILHRQTVAAKVPAGMHDRLVAAIKACWEEREEK
jgi:anti-sigma factor RsiW